MMFLTIVLIILPVVSLAADAEPPGGYYVTRFDHFDIENILNHKRLVVYYAACLLDKGPCTPQGTEFKNILPDAIKTNCLRCTEKQRVVTTLSIRRLQKEYPDIWSQLRKKWDPSGENVKRLLSSANKPKPVVPFVPLILDKFGDGGDVEPSEITSTTENTVLTSSTLMNALMTTSLVQSTTATPTSTSTKQNTKQTVAVTSRPFNSIGPNLIVPNPRILIDKVIHTANLVLNSILKG